MGTISFHHAITDTTIVNVLNLDFESSQSIDLQVVKHYSALGDIRKNADEVALTGQPLAAIFQAALMELSIGLPNITLFGFGRDTSRLGAFDLADFRHNQVRARRKELPQESDFNGITILDGAGRGFPNHQCQEIASSMATPTEVRILDISMGQVDPAAPEKGVVDKIIKSGVSVQDFTEQRVIFNPPGFSPLAVVMAVAIHGLSETWAQTMQLAKAHTTFHVVAVIDVQNLRQQGRRIYAEWEGKTAPVLIPQELLHETIGTLKGTDPELAAKLQALIS